MPDSEGRMAPTTDTPERLGRVERLADKHDLELHGDRGIFVWMASMEDRLKWINRALWAIALSIIGAAAAIILAGAGPT